jgi:ATP-dependent DNA helicase RecQ
MWLIAIVMLSAPTNGILNMSNLIGLDSQIDHVFQQRFAEIGQAVRPTQRKIIQAVIDGNNTLGLMPTGSGKSLSYWISGLILEGVTLVISPLTALMDEQAKKLKDHGCKVFVLHSGINSRQQYQELIDLYRERQTPDFIFLSPERMATDGFLEFVLQSIRDKIKLVVIDEAHCISQWGLDFRPFYKEIPHFLHAVFCNAPLPTILCLTATLNSKDCEQICLDFNIEKEHVIKHDMLLRPEINIHVYKVPNEEAKDEAFWRLLEEHRDEKVLIYVDRKQGKRSVETLCEQAIGRRFKAAYFHSGMSSEEKAEVIRKFKEKGELLTIFATSAFGMGIDIPDIRGVVHYLLTESAEQYYQQIGRAGRDGKPAWAVIFFSDKNVSVRKTWFIEKSFPALEDIQRAFSDLTDNQMGKRTVNFFNAGDSTQSAYHYLVRSSVITFVCKGVDRLDPFQLAKGVSLPAFTAYRNATITGLLILAAENVSKSESEILKDVYQWLAEGKIKAVRVPDKCLVVDCTTDTLPESLLDEIMSDAAQKKVYRLSVFDEFVALLEGYTSSRAFHQEIGEYLGIDRFSRQRTHQTLSGDFVRSKSEVIIANILHQSRIPFEYEKPLTASDGSYRLPDFTIEWNGITYYWEHLGMLDVENYAREWEYKKAWYARNFPGCLITSQESSTLSQETGQIVSSRFGVQVRTQENV